MTARPPGVTISPAGADDIGDVMTVMQAAFDPAFGEAWTEAQCLGIMGMPGTWLLVARIAEEPVGFALARAVGDEGELLLLAVVPEQRRGGVGSALLDRVIADGNRCGIAKLHLEVRDANSATHLYHRAGFRQVGIRKNYYRGRGDQVFDALTLSYCLAIAPAS
jgi:ribosomal-protein-alanine N-acetyltransferase